MRSTARSLRRNRDGTVPEGARPRAAARVARRVARVPVTALLAAALSVASASWALPVDGRVAAGFRYDVTRPFAAGARRGVDLRAVAGSPVRAACSGRVSHVGALPRWAFGVSLRCGRFVATHLGLRGVLVRRGERVRRGQRIGRVGPAGVVRLGARLSTERFGWVDPLALLARERPHGAPPGPVPPPVGPRSSPRRLPMLAPRPALRLGPAPRAALRLHAARPSARPAVVRSPPAAARRDAPILAWIAVALIAAGLPVAPVVAARRRRRRRRAAARTARAAAGGGRGRPIF